MKVSNGLLEALEFVEGSSKTVYKDIAGYETIGVGHLIQPNDRDLAIVLGRKFKNTDKLTDKQIIQLLELDLGFFISGVNSLVTVPLKQNEFDAIVMFAFNVGMGALKGSTLLKKLTSGDKEGAALELLRWNKARVAGVLKKAQGLVNRREIEKQIFSSSREYTEGYTFRIQDMRFIDTALDLYNN